MSPAPRPVSSNGGFAGAGRYWVRYSAPTAGAGKETGCIGKSSVVQHCRERRYGDDPFRVAIEYQFVCHLNRSKQVSSRTRTALFAPARTIVNLVYNAQKHRDSNPETIALRRFRLNQNCAARRLMNDCGDGFGPWHARAHTLILAAVHAETQLPCHRA